MSNQSIKKNK